MPLRPLATHRIEPPRSLSVPESLPPTLRRSLLRTLVASGACAVALLTFGAAQASGVCDPIGNSGIGAGDTADAGELQGFRATVHVNDFNNPQCTPIRSIYVFRNGSNAIEIGWWLREAQGLPRRVFWVTVENNVLDYHPTSYTPGAGTDKDFKIENVNNDYRWSLRYQGTFIENPQLPFHTGIYTQAASEREYQGDNLYGHFEAMQVCTNACNNYHNPANQVKTVDVNAGTWRWCKIDNREFFIRDSSC
jgi:hypothetical protein